MLIQQIIEFELREPGPPGRTCPPTTNYIQSWAPQVFFRPQSATLQPNFNFLKLQP